MSWKSKYLAEERVVAIEFGKEFQSNELPDLLTDMVAMLSQNLTFWVLADCRALEGKTSLFKIYDFPKIYASHGLDRRIKEAVILPQSPEAREDLKFYETVCRNLGLHVKAFETRQDGLDWLHA